MNRYPPLLLPALLLVTLLQGLPAAASMQESSANTASGATGSRQSTVMSGTGNSPDRVLAETRTFSSSAATADTTNSPPTADFNCTVTGLDVSCLDRSSDANGTIVSRNWDFGDGSVSEVASPSHSYEIPGTYSITLTVIDNDGGEDATSREIPIGND